ncbi:phage antirepressor KilAC domain-containing protein [Bacillus cereus group sp. Bc222]|uniref:phage antirepressor n=1 Tax=Bacillus TaxID=1386 RepID=UPI000C28EDCC|nr:MULTISPECIES: phage antirepressor KilAC domain-containing protein [Bacillus]AYY25283.1 phage repressor protein/antirepressor Ant [Bacillus sp. FDAARGOS_527]MCC2436374.1 phage antirepressor KilAC domain-containing protein [Bacillus paranthracis]MDA2013067.1 phage antirepressor KilAC domain-containing protein [Bacillus cereus group sp. Bcc09]MDA2242080.1 phage antirepressor KilAC domain-containing protein [Bacillus cereus group sp. Bc222]MDX5829386.1 phage antirepressor KilAC domain-containin
MNELKKFSHNMFGNLEILIKEGKEYFPATDVATALGYKRPQDAVRQHCKEDGSVNHRVADSLGRMQEKKYINEPNLYRLIVKSKLPQAEQFEKWVFEEVLPSIRKHGAYMTDQVLEQAVTNPDFMIGLLTNLKEEKAKRVEAERTILQQQPLVTFAEAVQVSTNLITVKQLANLMRQKGIDTGQNRLFEWFRENGYLCKKKGSLYNTPTQYSMDLELFESQEYVRTNSQGEFVTSFTTKVTGKGQLYFINKFLGKEAV